MDILSIIISFMLILVTIIFISKNYRSIKKNYNNLLFQIKTYKQSDDYKLKRLFVYLVVVGFFVIRYVYEVFNLYLVDNPLCIMTEKNYLFSSVIQVNATLIGLFLVALGVSRMKVTVFSSIDKSTQMEMSIGWWVSFLFYINTFLMLLIIFLSFFSFFTDDMIYVKRLICSVMALEAFALVNFALLIKEFYNFFIRSSDS
ncbi:MAG: hypothetical protein HPY60_09190 [Candidatus Methanofastidiosum sp.]|nr:hypothetical protein [Methanofastidiosum sp.]